MHLPLTTDFYRRLVTALILGTGFWISYMYGPPILFSALLICIVAIIIVCEWRRLFNIKSWPFWVTMPFYPVLPFIFLIILNHNPVYHPLLFILFMIVFSFDTGSYIVGSLLGVNELCPDISRGKTWEGFFGGYLFACIGLFFVLWERGISKSWTCIMLFTAVVCCLSLLGDLFESWLKRRAGVKDSGTLLPGHGGFLDRFDGILFAVFFFYCFRDFIVQLFYG
jgi:phosphatidate cytidylyltransferase